MFFRQMTEAFFVRTDPDSSMVKPAHIHITSAPQTRKENVLKTNWVSASTAACKTVVPPIIRRITAKKVAAAARPDLVMRPYHCAVSRSTMRKLLESPRCWRLASVTTGLP